MDHFVVLVRAGNAAVTIIDPALGRRKVSLREFAEKFTGVAIEVIQGPKFQKRDAPPSPSLRELAGPIRGLAKSLVVVFALALCLEAVSLVSPLIIQIVLDQVLTSSDINLLNLVAFGFTVLLLLQVTLTALRSWTAMWLSSHFNIAWSNTVFRHLLTLPNNYFMSRHMGDIVSRFGAVTVIQQTITTRFVSVIIDGMMASATLGMMLVYSSTLSIITIIAFLAYASLRITYFKVVRTMNLSQISDAARQQSTLFESIRAITSIRLSNQEATQGVKYLNASVATANSSIGLQRFDLWFRLANSLLFGMQRIAIIWFGAKLVLGGNLTAGMLLAFLAYVDQFAGRGAALIDYLVDLRLLRLQGERLSDIVHTKPEPNTDSVYVGPTPSATLSFNQVSFRYSQGEPWVLSGATFSVKEGETVAIIGPSGAGKSTIVRLIAGLLDPQVGSIELGGVDVKRLGKRELRRICGFITQDDHLFSGSIADNITFSDPDASLEQIIRAATLAQIHDDIAAMPMGYHTLIGDLGSTLSSGQQQRIIIARTLFRQPKILIMDEATSNLDVSREKALFDSLSKLGATRIIIAHRPETIRQADHVLVLAGGRLKRAEISKSQLDENILEDAKPH